MLRLLRHRGLSHRLRSVSGEAQADVRWSINEDVQMSAAGPSQTRALRSAEGADAAASAASVGAHHPGPLSGMRVLELAQIMAGPTCGMLLADMGADVIKVEKLPGGDDTRSYSEPLQGGESAAFMMLNRNKRGIAVNLKTRGGLEVVKKMLADADVVT